jgi:hypothetical protein
MFAAMATAAGMFAQPVADAKANHRWHWQFGWPFAYQGYYAPRPRYYYYEPEYYDPYYGEEDPYYYEPPPRRKKRIQTYYDDEDYYEPPLPKKKKKPSTVKVYSNPALEEQIPNKQKPPVTAAAPAKKPVAAAAPAKEPATQTTSGGVSCDKAKSILGDYGFASITPTDCEGSELGFKAQRDGKSFSIKVSSLSGELTEVKRQ